MATLQFPSSLLNAASCRGSAFCLAWASSGALQVFQRRFDGSVDFYRDWNDYTVGFGSANDEFWLGSDHIHSLTSSGSHTLRIDMERFNKETSFAEYVGFSIDAESSNDWELITSRALRVIIVV